MDNYGTAREDFQVMLKGNFKGESLDIIMGAFDYALRSYDLQVKENALAIYDGNAIEQMVEYYLIAMDTKNYRSQTLEERRRTLNRFFSMVGKSPTEITHQDILQYLYVQKLNGVAPQTINTYLSQLSAFFTWCIKRGIIDKNPIEAEDKAKYFKKEKQPLDEKQIDQVRNACQSASNPKLYRALVEFMLSTGMRREEICKAKKSDALLDKINDAGMIPIIVPDGKGGKERYTFINPNAYGYLTAYLDSRKDDSPYLFVNEYGNQMQMRKLNYIFENLRELTGIEYLTPHTMRRTFATNACHNGVAIQVVARTMGHSSVDTTMVYAKDTIETIMNQMEKAY